MESNVSERIPARWWCQPRWYRVAIHALWWAWTLLAALSALTLLACVLLRVPVGIPLWPAGVNGALSLALVLLIGRSMLVGVGISDEALLARHLWPGWRETIFYGTLQSARVRRVRLLRVTYLILHRGRLDWMLLPLAAECRSGICIPDWQGLVIALEEVLEPTGKWRE